ncbi:MAG: BACON domain-containing carbohydrate-binding protein [Rikenellaceae bacterium]
MNKIWIRFAITLSLLLSLACNPNSDDGLIGEIAISPAVLTFESSGGRLCAVVSSNADWSLEDETIQYWYNVEPTSGTSGDTLVVELVANSYTVARSVSLPLYCRDASTDLLIMQYAASVQDDDSLGGLEEDQTEGEVEDESNDDVEQDIEPESEESQETGDEEQTTPDLDVEILPDSSTSEPDDNSDLELELQDPDVGEPDVTEPDITEPDVTEPDTTEPDVTEPDTTEPDVAEPDTTEPDEDNDPLSSYRLEFTAAGGSRQINITTEMEWSIALPLFQSWLSASSLSGVGSEQVTISAGANATGAAREVEIRVAVDSQTLYVTVYQAAE